MTKNILVLVGSPRHNGNTELLADVFIKGAVEEGNKVTKYVLQGKKILPCIDCQACFKTGKCILEDDMDEVYELLRTTNILVLASPVYFYGISAQLKALLDRLHNPVRDTFPINSSVLLSVCADTAEAFIPSIAMFKNLFSQNTSLKNIPIAEIKDINLEKVPQHIAIIMDGNGRWAKAQGMPRTFGHNAGAQTLKTIVRFADKLGVKVLSAYVFSTENWKRPITEVNFIMELLSRYLTNEIDEFNENNVQVRFMGSRIGLPTIVNQKMDHGGVLDRCDSLLFVVPLAYYYIKYFLL